jgi:glycosyltransferase involved in cell wall biosynthesis
VIVYNHTIYRENPYHQVLHRAIARRFQPVRADVERAIEGLRAGQGRLLHLHWEEHCLRPCRTGAEARAVAEHLLEQLGTYRALGGRLLWTIHNLMPHELEHPDEFLALRHGLAGVVDRILVHSTEAVSVLAAQVGDLRHDRLFYMPHPSYLGLYEDEALSTGPEPVPSSQPVALLFGKVRRYKGFDRLLEAYAGAGPRPAFAVRVVGQPIATDSYGPELLTRFGAVPGIELDFRHVPDGEVAPILRAASCLVLPYERFLTSGASMLGLTFGLPTVAPDTPQMRELLPGVVHGLLYSREEPGSLLRAVERAVGLAGEAREVARHALLRRARHLHPVRVSRTLGGLYDSILAA